MPIRESSFEYEDVEIGVCERGGRKLVTGTAGVYHPHKTCDYSAYVLFTPQRDACAMCTTRSCPARHLHDTYIIM